MKNLKTILPLLLIAALTIPLAVIPDIISPDVEGWCKITLGEDYKTYLILFFVVGSVLIVFLTSDLNIFKNSKAPSKFNIKWNEENKTLIQKAKRDIERARSADALNKLVQIDSEELGKYVSPLKARLSGNQLREIQGTETYERTTTTENKLNRDILSLISIIESNQAEDEEYILKIKEYLRERYSNRLSQKLAGRQPVNLRRLPSTEGTSEEQSVAFITYNEEEIRDGIGKIFEDANGRLLIIGGAGSGKTTLMLQLELYLIESARNAIPVILNLATWQSEFTTIEDWLLRILPAEMGVNKALANKVVEQYPLILLLDGFDEIKKEERNGCLDSIGKYSADTKHRFVIASRIGEYKEVAKDAPVYSQIEIGALTIEQIEHELERVGRSQPEALPLLNAIRSDELLREAVKTPFYFNTMQLMFAQGRRLSDLDFSAKDLEGRQDEITQKFIEITTSSIGNYTNENIKRWLSFLGFNMNRHNLVVFELVNLQYSWSNWTKNALTFAIAAKGIVGEMVGGLVFGLVAGLVGGLLVVGLFTGLFLGLFASLSVGLLKGLEYILIYRKVGGLVKGLVFGLSFGLLFSLLGILFGELVGGVVGSLVGGLFVGIAFSIDYEYRNFNFDIYTNDTIKWSLKTIIKSVKKRLVEGLVFGLVFGLVIGLLIGLFKGMVAGLVIGLVTGPVFGFIDTLKNEKYYFLQIKTPYKRFIASAQNLYFSILQHLILRYQLHKKGLLPLQLVRFLNHLTRQHLFESDGTSWRFRHRVLQDYFANLWVHQQKGKENSSASQKE